MSLAVFASASLGVIGGAAGIVRVPKPTVTMAINSNGHESRWRERSGCRGESAAVSLNMMNPLRRRAVRQHGRWTVGAAVIVVLFGLQAGWADEPLRRFEFHRKAMGVDFTVVLYGAKKGAANTAAQAALDRVTRIDANRSDYRATSGLRRLCAAAPPRPALPRRPHPALAPPPPPPCALLTPGFPHR